MGNPESNQMFVSWRKIYASLEKSEQVIKQTPLCSVEKSTADLLSSFSREQFIGACVAPNPTKLKAK
jgi:hypothetical protein